jgi:hypothetical protein
MRLRLSWWKGCENKLKPRRNEEHEVSEEGCCSFIYFVLFVVFVVKDFYRLRIATPQGRSPTGMRLITCNVATSTTATSLERPLAV